MSTIRESIKRFIRDYFIIYTGCMLGTLVFCSIFYPDASFNLSYFRWMLLMAFVSDLPIFVLYSKRDLTEKQMLFRSVIHLLLVEGVLLLFANYLELYETAGEAAVFALIVLGVYVLVKMINYRGDFKTAMKINEKLKERSKDQQETS